MGKKAVIVAIIVAGIILFGYTQYASASQINAKITESRLIQKSDKGSQYNLKLEFHNPSLLILNAGKTEFTISADGQTIGGGNLDPFLLPALGKATTNGMFLRDKNTNAETPEVKISGITKYQLLFASVDIPFTYYPSQDQTREFIHDA